jgi:hypothetical protein
VCWRAWEEWLLTNDLNDTRRWWQKRLHESQDIGLDLVGFSAQQLTGAFLLKTFESGHMGAEDELVDGLDEILVKLLALLLLLRPVVGVCLGVNAVNLLVVLDQSIDGVGSELVSDFVAQHHVDVDNVSLKVNELIAEVLLVGFSWHVGLGALWEHDGGECPDGI